MREKIDWTDRVDCIRGKTKELNAAILMHKMCHFFLETSNGKCDVFQWKGTTVQALTAFT